MVLYAYRVSKIRPPDINIEPTVETDEVKKIQEILRDSIESNHKDDEFLGMFSLWKALGIKCWIRRFTVNCRKSSKERIRDLLRRLNWKRRSIICSELLKNSAEIKPGSRAQVYIESTKKY